MGILGTLQIQTVAYPCRQSRVSATQAYTKHRFAYRAARKWLTPLSRFWLTHSLKISHSNLTKLSLPLLINHRNLKGLIRFSCFVGQFCGKGSHCLQRAVWRNGGCGSLESTTKQQITRLVASTGSPPLRQAATTLAAMRGRQCVLQAKRTERC